MYSALLVGVLVLHTLVDGESNSKYDIEINSIKHGITNSIIKNNVASHHNITYIEKAENLLRTPININKIYEEHKKKKKPKKTPKRTIQRIIKKNRGKLRKVYLTKKSKQTTVIPKIDYEKLYGQEENKQWRDEKTTTTASKKKTKRKYSPKQSGYHMPFQKLHKMEHRHKRGVSRELYILKDLDEIQFLSKQNDQDGDVVKAHVKKFW